MALDGDATEILPRKFFSHRLAILSPTLKATRSRPINLAEGGIYFSPSIRIFSGSAMKPAKLIENCGYAHFDPAQLNRVLRRSQSCSRSSPS